MDTKFERGTCSCCYCKFSNVWNYFRWSHSKCFVNWRTYNSYDAEAWICKNFCWWCGGFCLLRWSNYATCNGCCSVHSFSNDSSSISRSNSCSRVTSRSLFWMFIPFRCVSVKKTKHFTYRKNNRRHDYDW